MAHPMDIDPQTEETMNAQFLAKLRATFDSLPNSIELMLFTEKGREDVYCDATRQVVRAFRSLTDKITIRSRIRQARR